MVKKYKKGFTLIEMLIVVAIIGILASIVVIGIGPAQKKGRDARRSADLRQVQIALELFNSKFGHYPGIAIPVGSLEDSSCGSIAQWSDLSTCLTASSIGVTSVPSEQITSKKYVYATNADGTSYVLEAILDDTGSSLLQGSIKGTINNVDCSASAAYCISL